MPSNVYSPPTVYEPDTIGAGVDSKGSGFGPSGPYRHSNPPVGAATEVAQTLLQPVYCSLKALLLVGALMLVACGGGESKSGSQPNPSPVNPPPTAEAGDDLIAIAGTTVTLDGSGSSDPGGGTVTYLWKQMGGGPTVAFSNVLVANPTFIAPMVVQDIGLAFELTVTDGGGLTARSTVRVTVSHQAPVADAGGARTVTAGTTVTLDGSGSSDPEGGTLRHAWWAPADVTLIGGDTTTPTFTAPIVTEDVTLEFLLTVTDPGGKTHAATVSITVIAPRVAIEGMSIISAPHEKGTYGKSEMIMVEVTFSDYVTVSGTPYIALQIGRQTRQATYRGGSGTRTLRFGYVAEGTDRSIQGISVLADALSKNGGAIVDGNGNDAVLSNDESIITNAEGHDVDGTIYRPPTPVNVRVASRPIQGDTYGATENIEIEVEFGEEVTVTGRPSLALAIGGQTHHAFYEGGSGTPTLTFGYVVADTDRDADGIAIASNALSMNGGQVLDSDGNSPESIPDSLMDAAFTQAGNPKVDGGVDHPPVVVDVRIASSPLREDVYGATEHIEVDVVFSESVVVEGRPTLALTLGTAVRNVAYETGYTGISSFARISPYLGVRPDLYSKNTHSLTFLYAVDTPDHDSDGIDIAGDALSLTGGRIFDIGGNDANLALGDHAIGTAAGHKVDGSIDRAPFVTDIAITSSPAHGDTYGTYQSISVNVRFSEPVAIKKSDGLMGDISNSPVGRPSIELTLDSSEEPWILGVYYHDFGIHYANVYEFTLLGAFPEGIPQPPGITSSTWRAEARGLITTPGVDLDGISILADALVLNGGTIQDAKGNDAELDIGDHVIVNAADHKVDTRVLPAYVEPRGSVGRENPTRTQYNHENHADDDIDTYRTGDILYLWVDLPSPLYKDIDVSGSPALMVQIGSHIRHAELVSYRPPNYGIDIFALRFRYVIAPDDFSLTGIKYLGMSGGNIVDQQGRVINVMFDEGDAHPWITVLPNSDSAHVDPAHIEDIVFWAYHSDWRPRVSIHGNYYSSPRDYAYGEPMIIAVQMSEPVVVEGTPLLALTIGSKTRFAQYRTNEDYSEFGLDGDSFLFFSYTVHPSDFDLGPLGLPQKALIMDGGSIKTKSGEPVDLSLPESGFRAKGGLLLRDNLSDGFSGGVNGGLVRGAALSWAAIAPKPPEDKILHLGEHIYLWVYFSREVSFTEEPYAVLMIGSQERRLSFHEVDPVSQGSGLLFRYTISESDFGRVRMPENPIRGTIVDSSDASAGIDLGWRAFGDGDYFVDGGRNEEITNQPHGLVEDEDSTASDSGSDYDANPFLNIARSLSYACQAAPSGSPNAVMSDIPTSGTAPLRLSLDATGSSSGNGAGLMSHRWYLNASVLLHDGPGPHEVVLPPGNHRIQLDVTDANGNSDCIEKAIAVGLGGGSTYGVDVYDDRVITIDVANIIDAFDFDEDDSEDKGLFIQHVSWVLYTYFQDDFDFLLLLFSNDPSDSFLLGNKYSNVVIRAQYHGAQNSIAGLGPGNRLYSSHYDYTAQFGSKGRLQGTAVFGDRTMLWDGTGLHEIMHRWGNYMIPTADEEGWLYHWGLSSAYGQLGGFDLRYLEKAPRYNDVHGDAYRIVDGGFSPYGAWIPGNANEHRYVDVYSPLELYLMGLVPIDDVPTIWAAPDAVPARVREFGQVQEASDAYIVPRWTAYDQERILREFGPRNPPYGQAQTEFKAAVVLMTTDGSPPTEQELQRFSRGVREFSLRGDDGVEDQTNFWEATGGRATMEMDRLSLSRKAVPTPPVAVSPTPAAFERLRRGEGIKAPPIH